MVQLVPMEQKDFESYLERDIQAYAEEHVRNGNWKKEEALELSRKEHQQLLPDGLQSKNQYLCSIIDDRGNKIGILWMQVKDQKAFIYDFAIGEAFRSKGYGRQALMAMDEKLKSMNVESVDLHVFGDNLIAQELYKKTGFQVTGIYMKKVIK